MTSEDEILAELLRREHPRAISLIEAKAYEDAAKIADGCPCDGVCCSQWHAADKIRAKAEQIRAPHSNLPMSDDSR